jgi:hypothetical protein
MLWIQKPSLACALLATVLIAGCGSSSSSSSHASQSGSGAGSGSSGQAAGALSADARSAATGDIPDNQVFLVFTNRAGGYSIKYPEGWTRSGSGRDVTFRDKNNLVHVLIARGATPTPRSVAAQLSALRRSHHTLSFRAPRAMMIASGPAVRAVYSTVSAPNPVTGRRVTLVVDRYELAHSGRVAMVDLGTPRGVDNVDAYRMMIESFRWR